MPRVPGRSHKQEAWRYFECNCLSRGCNGARVTARCFKKHKREDEVANARREQARISARTRNNALPSLNVNQEHHSEPEQDAEQGADCMPEYDSEQGTDSDSEPAEGETDYIANNPIYDLPNWDEPIQTGNDKTLAQAVYQFLDLSTRQKLNGVTGKGVWEFGDFMRGPLDMPYPKHSKIERLLKKHREQTTIRVDCCINMCVAYWNPTHPDLHGPKYFNAHRSVCPNPECMEPRYIIDPKSKKKIARRFFFYLPFKYWLQDFFTRPALIPSMANDLDPESYPDGHIRRSDGWRKKVIENDNINCDRRHKAISLASDGVPYFDEQGSASGWPIMLIDETLPNGLARTTEHAHMVALIPSSYKCINNDDPLRPRIVTKRR
jgi:hypothetical protein